MSRDKNDRSSPKKNQHILTPDEVASGRKSNVTGVLVKGNVRNLSKELFKMEYLTKFDISNNQLQYLPPEIGLLKNLKVLDASCNKIMSIPREIGNLVNLRELHLSKNKIHFLPYEMGRLFLLQVLDLNNNPLNSEFSSLYSEKNEPQKLLSYLLDSLPIPGGVTEQEILSQPPKRDWVVIGEPSQNPPHAIFTVMCYNVLCEKYATRQLYGYCPTWALQWSYRKSTIMRDIRYLDPDIMALQEVETEQFHQFFQPELDKLGYRGIFSPKSRAKTMTENEKKFVDGCAIFFKTAKFRLVREYLIEFNQIAIRSYEGSEEMLNRVMTKDNIGLAAMLETEPGVYQHSATGDAAVVELRGEPLLVCTAHIHWDPEFSDVKLIQSIMLMNELKKLVEEQKEHIRDEGRRDPDSIPLVLCGDLNSLPDSGVIEFLKSGRISTNHDDFKELSYESCLQKLCTSSRGSDLLHAFRLSSAYNRDLLPFTNFTYDFKDIIDYIFYSTNYLRPLGVLGKVDEEWFHHHNVIGCPNPIMPSDHIPLFCEFEMDQLRDKKSTSSHS